MLFLDGIYVDDKNDEQRFVKIPAPKESEMLALTHEISLRVAQYLERAGIISRDAENTFFADDVLKKDGMVEHRAHSINYLISMGPQKGRKVFTLKLLPPRSEERQGEILGKVAQDFLCMLVLRSRQVNAISSAISSNVYVVTFHAPQYRSIVYL